MRLYVCWGTMPPSAHPCRSAYDALVAAGHAPEVVRTYGQRFLPDFPFNLGRRRVKALTGKVDVPALELADGRAISGSGEIAAWARANPA